MKFLLIAVNAKYIHSNPAIYSLRAYAGAENQKHIELAEYTINQQMEEILRDIYKRKPDAIGISCYIWNWRMVSELLGELPKLLPDCPIWLGGPEVSYDPDVLLSKYPQLTGIMIGEGEVTFKEVLAYYLNRQGEETQQEDPEGEIPKEDKYKSLLEIPGLYIHSGYTPMRGLTDLSSIPFLYSDLAPFENKIIYYESSRGCPYRCSYCLSSIDKAVRLRDITIVKKELQFFLDHKVKQVKFVDRTFNCNHQHAMEIWSYLKEYDNGVTNFHFEISADILREDEIEILNSMRPGLAQLEIGVQTINPDTIKAIQRVMNVDRLEQIVRAIRTPGNIHMHLDLIAGLPYENYESFRKSFNRVYGMKPDQLQLGFLKVLKGSAMWEKATEYGIEYLENPPYEVLYTKWISYEEICRLKRVEEMVELYYNSGQFNKTIPVLENAFDSAFDMYEALADFYEANGYFTNSPARVYRYQILLQFAEQYDGGHLDLYKELLTYDMYLRENMKSRPDFATNLTAYRDKIFTFFQKEEQQRVYLPDYKEYDWKQMSKMTHLEPFHYPVYENAACEDIYKRTETETLVLFDYRNHRAFPIG